MELYRVALLNSIFSGKHRFPLLQLGLLGVGAIILGILIGNNLRDIPFMPAAHPQPLFYAIIFLYQILFIILLFGKVHAGRSDTFLRIVSILPISTRRLWLLWLMPGLALSVLSWFLFAWPTYIIFTKLGVHAAWVTIGMIIGILTAFGLLYGLPFRTAKARGGVILISLSCAGFLLQNSLGVRGLLSSQLATVFFAILCALQFVLFCGSMRQVRLQIKDAATTAVHILLRPMLWFYAKWLRFSPLRISFLSAFVLSFGLAVLATRNHWTDIETIGTFASLLAASLASDTRSASRKHGPAEITALRATHRFVATQFWSAIVVCLLATSPLFYIAVLYGAFSIVSVATLLVYLIAGSAIGLFASTVIAPEERTIGAQFLTILITVGLFLGVAALPVNAALQRLSYGASAILLILATFGIEYKRNKFSWRHHV